MTTPDPDVAGRLEIRSLRRIDIDAVLRVDEQCYATLWPRDLVEAEVTRDDRHHLVACFDGVVVGHGSFMYVLDEATLTTVAVEPALRGSGIASAVLVALLNDAIDRAVSAVTLEVRASNEAAQSLYEKFGFEVEGHRKRYYEPDGEDAVIMWLRGLDTDEVRDRIDVLAASVAWNGRARVTKG